MVKLAPLPKQPESTLPKLPPDSNLPTANFIGLSVGRMSQGKTVSLVRMFKSYPIGYWTRFCIISSTAGSQRHLWDYLGCDYGRDVFEASSTRELMAAMATIQEQIGAEYIAFRDEAKYIVTYDKLARGQPLTPNEQHLLFTRDAAPPNRTLQRPVCAILVDDQMACGSITSKAFLATCIKHRHACKGAGYSICVAVQSLKSSASRPLRLVASFWMLFKCEDRKQIDEIADEVAGHINKEEFFEAFREATAKEHSFLTINLMTRDKAHLMTESFERNIVLT